MTDLMEVVQKMEKSQSRSWQIVTAILTFVVVLNTATAGVVAWNVVRIRKLAQVQHDFAEAHATASYQRAEATIHVVQCADQFFLRYFNEKPPPPEKALLDCFNMPVQTPTIVPLPRETTR